MPYRNLAKLPITVEKLPVLGQRMWLRVFNRAINKKTDDQAVAAAWAVVHQFYKRNVKGNWVKKK